MCKVIVYVCDGMVECEDAPDDIIVELHDYNIGEIKEDDPDHEYGYDLLGNYEVIRLHTPH